MAGTRKACFLARLQTEGSASALFRQERKGPRCAGLRLRAFLDCARARSACATCSSRASTTTSRSPPTGAWAISSIHLPRVGLLEIIAKLGIAEGRQGIPVLLLSLILGVQGDPGFSVCGQFEVDVSGPTSDAALWIQARARSSKAIPSARPTGGASRSTPTACATSPAVSVPR